ncbi:MAG: response regulator transcription factor [Anaerolineae bacterium]|nr:response regulator transcription factor [Anaerolineae bacterium]
MIRVLLADDQVLFREALHTLLSTQPEIEVVAEAGTGEEAIQLAVAHQPQVALMDVQMPVLDGVAATRQLRTLLPECQIIMLTTFDDDEYVFEGLRAGAVGYLLKDSSAQRLVEAIQTAARGETFLQPSIAAKVVRELTRQTASPLSPQPLIEPLTAREIEILRLMAQGHSNREIADTLVITEGTAKNHITNIFGKLGVRDRTQAVLKAQSLRLV